MVSKGNEDYIGIDTRRADVLPEVPEGIRARHLNYLNGGAKYKIGLYPRYYSGEYSVISERHLMCLLMCYTSKDGNSYSHEFPNWDKSDPLSLPFILDEIVQYASKHKDKIGKKIYVALQMSDYHELEDESYTKQRLKELEPLSTDLEKEGFEIDLLPVHNTTDGPVTFTIDQDNIVCWNKDKDLIACFETPKYSE